VLGGEKLSAHAALVAGLRGMDGARCSAGVKVAVAVQLRVQNPAPIDQYRALALRDCCERPVIGVQLCERVGLLHKSFVFMK